MAQCNRACRRRCLRFVTLDPRRHQRQQPFDLIVDCLTQAGIKKLGRRIWPLEPHLILGWFIHQLAQHAQRVQGEELQTMLGGGTNARQLAAMLDTGHGSSNCVRGTRQPVRPMS
jgi:hypothetical protein